MRKEIKKIAIVGSGTAGIATALILKTKFEDCQIDVIHSSNIGIIGVGEGSTEHWKEFMQFVGIDQYDLIRKCDATYKMGIMFDNWTEQPYFHSVQHPFTKKHAQYSYIYAKQIAENKLSNELSSKIYWENKVNQWWVNRPEEFLANQFHFNTYKLNEFLTEFAKNLGIGFIDDEILDVNLDEVGYVESLTGKANSYSYDFYIDSTGFRRILMNKLGAKWVSYKKYLRMKSAVVFQTEDTENYNIWTLARAMDYGWLFRIPVYGRHGNGYIYDGDLIDSNYAEQEIEKLYGRKVQIGKQFNFDPGALDRVWIKNCCAVGLSGSFFEPLEATSIGTSIQQAFLLMHRLKNYDDKIINDYNKSFLDIVENIRDFIALHYMTKKSNTEFWRSFSKENVPDSLLEKLDIWKHKLPIHEDFKNLSDYILFREDNFTLVLHGLGLFDIESIKKEYLSLNQKFKTDAELTLAKEEEFVNSIKKITHKEYIEMIRKLY